MSAVTGTPAEQSALLVEVPAAETAVGDVRRHLDPAAALGVPAHVTALFPFLPPDTIDDDVRGQVTEIAASFPALDVGFARTAWFGDAVLWLAPDDPLPLRRLTAALVDAFPDQLPYGGEYDDVVPHLTVGMVGDTVDVDALRAAEVRATAVLPVVQRVDRLALWVGSAAPGSWRRLETYTFSG